MGLLRTRRAIAILAAVAVAFSLLIIARWPSDGVVDLSGAASREVFRVFAYSLTAAVALLVPVFPSTSFVQEKQTGTLALLLNSAMGPVAIYLGKLAGSLGFVLLLLSATIPATAACFTLGGVSLSNEILPLYLVLSVASVLFTTWALLFSTIANSTDGAVRGAFAGVLVLFLLVLLPHYFLDGSESSLASSASILRNISPVPAVMDVVGHGDVGSRQLESQNSGVKSFALFGGVLSLLFAGMTIGRLNHSLLDRARSQGSVTDDRGLGVRLFRRLMFLIDPQRRKAGIGPLTNPVMVKEFRSRQFGRLHWLLRIVGGCAVISLGLAFAATLGSEEWGVETIGGIIVSMQAALIVLFTPSLASGLISSERESGSWELLRMTPLSASRIVRGKLLSVVWTLLILLMASLPGYGVMIWIKPILQEQITQVLICLTIGAVFAILLSAAVSSFFRRTAPSTVTAYSILLFLWAGSLLMWMGRDAPFGYSAVQTALTVNPMAAALSVIGTPGFQTYNLVPINWWVTGIGSFLLLVVLLVQTRRITRPE
jgi:ABC-type transport system involved in multi-copper enzyme maturation permease subunit